MEPNLGVLKSRPPLGKRRIHSDGYTSATTDERFGIGKRFTDSSIAVHFDSLFQLKNEPEGSLRVWLRKAPFLILY